MRKKIKILIVGITGQVGKALYKQLNSFRYELICISRKTWDMSKCPDYGEVIVRKYKPDLVINSAAYTNVEKAENDKEDAICVNLLSVKALANACKEIDAVLIQISTDYVFDGTKKSPYLEDDKPNPLNFYGKSKFLGEQAVLLKCPKHIIIRTSSIFSETNENFVKAILSLSQRQKNIKVVNNQMTGPTSAKTIADAISKIIEKFVSNTGLTFGIFHFCGLPHISFFKFAEFILEKEIQKNQKAEYVSLSPIKSDQYRSKAVRPCSVMLDTSKISKIYGVESCNWRADVTEMIANLYQ